MSNKKITDLPELTNPTTDDVFPIVDIATNTTLKVQVGNLPVQTAVTTALATKQATLVSGTNIKTINSATLLDSGDIALQTPLVSGTNIKTINGTSVLGSGDIVTPYTPPSGVSGAIQFSNGSAFASDAANLFWDDTNNRLGVGTNAPSAILQAENSTNGVLLARFKDAVASTSYIDIKNDVILNEYTGLYWGTEYRILSKAANPMIFNCANGINFADGYATKMVVTPSEVQIGSISGARLGIKGSGSTSATTSLLVQNSAGTMALSVKDNLETEFGGATTFNTLMAMRSGSFLFEASNAGYLMNANGLRFGNSIGLLFGSVGANSGSPDTGFNRSSAGTLKVTNGSTGYGSIDTSLYKVSGTNGFTGTGNYTNFTIVGGIITNAS
jgi:hypothetical protein